MRDAGSSSKCPDKRFCSDSPTNMPWSVLVEMETSVDEQQLNNGDVGSDGEFQTVAPKSAWRKKLREQHQRDHHRERHRLRDNNRHQQQQQKMVSSVVSSLRLSKLPGIGENSTKRQVTLRTSGIGQLWEHKEKKRQPHHHRSRMVLSNRTIPKRPAPATLRAEGKRIKSKTIAKTIAMSIRITMKKKEK